MGFAIPNILVWETLKKNTCAACIQRLAAQNWYMSCECQKKISRILNSFLLFSFLKDMKTRWNCGKIKLLEKNNCVFETFWFDLSWTDGKLRFWLKLFDLRQPPKANVPRLKVKPVTDTEPMLWLRQTVSQAHWVFCKGVSSFVISESMVIYDIKLLYTPFSQSAGLEDPFEFTCKSAKHARKPQQRTNTNTNYTRQTANHTFHLNSQNWNNILQKQLHTV